MKQSQLYCLEGRFREGESSRNDEVLKTRRSFTEVSGGMVLTRWDQLVLRDCVKHSRFSTQGREQQQLCVWHSHACDVDTFAFPSALFVISTLTSASVLLAMATTHSTSVYFMVVWVAVWLKSRSHGQQLQPLARARFQVLGSTFHHKMIDMLF
jgi:hypothetical protein